MKNTPSPGIPPILTEARWIWPDSNNWDLYNCYALFRKAVVLPVLPKRAPFFITADQSYQLFVNGRYVCRGPARGFQKSWPFDEMDLRPFLHPGENVIAVRAYNPGRSNFQYVHEGFAGLLAAAQWGGVKIVTDSTWKCRRQGGISRGTTPTSLQLFPQESIDLRVEDPAWNQPDFVEGDEWVPHEMGSSVWNAMPWHSLEARGLPLLEETLAEPAAGIGIAKGRNAPGWNTDRNLAINRFKEGLAHRACSAAGPVFEFPAAGKGRWTSRLIDFGKVVVGSVLLEIDGAQGGETVETFHGETIDAAGLEPHFVPEAHCRMAFAHRLICREGAQEHPFYHAFGFRYLVLTVRENRRPLRVRLSLRTTLYPLKEKGVLRSSNARLERIWKACAWTERICSMDAYVDTPWREQAQWWGDARVQAWNTFHLDGDPRLLRRGIRQIGMQTAPSGITYGHAPTMAHSCILPDFTLIWMATMWDDYWQTGSTDSFLSQQPALERALAYFEEWTDPKSGLLRFDPRYWLFLDWTDIQREGSSSVYTFWLLYALDRLAALYIVTGRKPSARRCARWAARVRAALRALRGSDGLIGDGILPGGRRNRHCSVHAQTLALMTRLNPADDRALLERSLLPFVRGEADPSIRPSAYWITYVYTELAQRGFGREVLADIERKWAPMADFGSTFEGFASVPGQESHSHAWSAHPLFHLMQILGGIRQSAPAWESLTFAPTFYGDHAEVRVPTPRGEILSSWRREASGHVAGRLVVPQGTRASLRLPAPFPAEISGGKPFDFRLDPVAAGGD